jgi:hypothetical protein
MSNLKWKLYNSTEDDCIEYNQCLERFLNAGFSMELADAWALNCHVCCLSGVCTVSRENVFLGARTC